MIHSNQRFISAESLKHAVDNNQLKVLVMVLMAGMTFFGLASLNVMAANYSHEVDDQVASCIILKNKVNSLALSPVVDKYCAITQPYILGISLPKAREDTLNLQSIINDYQDLLREKRRVLIDQQKQLAQELTAFGVTAELNLPSRDDMLDAQVDFLSTQVNDLTKQYEHISEDFSNQINTYKYFLYVENRRDGLGIIDLIDAKQDIKAQYTSIQNQNNEWIPNSTTYANNKYILEYPILSPQDFIDLTDQVTLLKSSTATYYSVITGSVVIDKAIVDNAIERGYKPRAKIDETLLAPVEDQRLSRDVITSWNAMKDEAQKAGIGINITSGYRSEEAQRDLFAGRLHQQAFSTLGRDLTEADVFTSVGQQIISKTLELTAPPGYSKHHAGHTVDIGYIFGPDQKTVAFADTAAFAWLSNNNYYNAKKFGFIPSYPKNAQQIGPAPEAWEYVWIGKLSAPIYAPTY